MMMGREGVVESQRLARCCVTFTTVWEFSNGRKFFVLKLGNKEYKERFCCIVDHDRLAYICEKIMIFNI